MVVKSKDSFKACFENVNVSNNAHTNIVCI